MKEQFEEPIESKVLSSISITGVNIEMVNFYPTKIEFKDKRYKEVFILKISAK